MGVAGALSLALVVVAIHAHSLSGDGAYHLLAGHQALRYGQNTLNLEHPPLVKLVMAAPQLLESEALAPPVRTPDALAAADAMHLRPELVRRATLRGRYLLAILFGLPFLVASWFLGRRFGGRRAAWTLALLLALAFCIFPSLAILQTDSAVSLAFVLTLLAGLAFMERPDISRATLLGLCVGLGLATKFSGVLLAPTVLASLLMAPDLRRRWRARLGQAALIAALAWVVVDVSYAAANRSYSSVEGREVIQDYAAGRGTLVVADHMKGQQELLLAVEKVDPYLAQWLTGLLGHQAQDRVSPYPSYAFGQVFSRGRWWYLPALLLVKTPLPILGLGLFALTLHRPGRPRPGPWILPALTAIVYVAAYLGTSYNLGVRHLLPILPILFLPVALAAARSHAVAAILLLSLAVEAIALAPYWASATNTWWLGSRNPTRWALGAGNTEYRLNFVQLARVAEQRGIEDLFVLHPAASSAVVHAYLPHARLMDPGEKPGPGWYAVNVMFEQYLPALLRAPKSVVYQQDALTQLARRWEPGWRAIQEGEDHGYVAGTFHLFRVLPAPEEKPAGSSSARDGEPS